MSDVKLGLLCDETSRRDAIHVAIEPTVAPCELVPGEHVDKHGNRDGRPLVGIVDPFLRGHVKKGQTFYLCLYLGTVTSLRHHWTHPEFKEVDDSSKAKARDVIESEATSAGLDYQEMMAAAHDWVTSEEYLCEGGRWEGHIMADQDKFWDAYELLTGEKPKYRSSFFTCSC